MTANTSIFSIFEFLDVAANNENTGRNQIYRGQADIEWRVDCSAVRRLADGSELGPTVIGHSLIAYTDNMMKQGPRSMLEHVLSSHPHILNLNF